MSYCRFGQDGSAVYVFPAVFATARVIVCHECKLDDEGETFQCAAAADMLSHLRRHREAGHTVPSDAIDRLTTEAREATAHGS